MTKEKKQEIVMTMKSNETTENTLQLLPPEKAITIIKSLEDEFAGEVITWNLLEKIKVPAGGITVWSFAKENEIEVVPHFDAVIAYNRPLRSYWEGAFTGNNTPPDCQSFDLVYGTSGRSCPTCPFSKFGSATTGKGQACRQLRLLALVFPNKILPSILILPPTSLNNFLRYRLTLVEQGLTSDRVLTRFSLAQNKSSQGIVYSQVHFKKVQEYTSIDLTPIKKIFTNIQIALTQADVMENIEDE